MAMSYGSRMFFSRYYFFLFFCHFLFNTKSTRKFVSGCPLGYLLFIQGWKKKGSNFWTSCFWFSQGEVETCYKAPWKTTRSLWRLVVYLFQMWEQQDIFHRKTGQVCWWGNDRPYSTSAEIATINGGTDHATNAQQKSAFTCPQLGTTTISSYRKSFREWWQR